MSTEQFTQLKNEIISRLTGNFNIKEIILFGSYAYGKPTQDSDIDLAIITNERGISENFSARMERKNKITSSLIDVMKKMPLDVLVFTSDEWDYVVSVGSSFTREISEKGVSLR